MSKTLHYLLGIVLFLSLVPVRGMSQTPDDNKSDKAERAHRTHVVKKAWSDTKQTTAKDYHATAHATGTAWKATKHGVSKGYHATAKATGKAWSGTKKAVSKGYNNTIHPSAKGTHTSSVKHREQVKQQDEAK